MKLALHVVSPPGYPHSQAFRELVDTLCDGATSLGYDVIRSDVPHVSGRRTIVLGPHLLSRSPLALPPDAILYNVEPVDDPSWFTPEILELFRRHPVWDYSARNAAALGKLGVPSVQVVPIGWSPCLRRITPEHEEIDILLYGSTNARRKHVIDELETAGVKVSAVCGVYGEERDRLIAKSKIVLNVHDDQAKAFNIVPVSYLLANGRLVVSERGSAPDEEEPFAAGVAFAEYDSLAPRCLELLDRPDDRAQIAEAGRRLMEGRPIAVSLAPVLEAEARRSAESSLGPRGYYGLERLDVVSRIHPAGRAILELGCAAGAMGARLRAGGAREVVGIEVVAEAAAMARMRLHAVYRQDLGTLPTLPYPDGYFDYIICADVLEHLAQPESVLRHMRRWLHDGGRLVCSIPNVRHESVLLPLLVDGAWEYQDAGILDRTHLRFFTLRTIRALLATCGFAMDPGVLEVVTPVTPELEKAALFVESLGGDANRFRAEARVFQYVFVARPVTHIGTAVPPIPDPWRGSRCSRLLVVPNVDGPDRLEPMLRLLANGPGADPTLTVGVALPPELLRNPPVAIDHIAALGKLDLLLIEAPTDEPGWKRLLAGASALVTTPPMPKLVDMARWVGVEVLELT